MKSFKVFVGSLLLFPSWALGWDSSIVYHDPDTQRLVYASDEDGNRIVDFSHAGYRGGTVALPKMAVVETISPVSGDNTAHIQRAINAVAARTPNESGHRGAILLKRGIYRVSGIVYINTSGIVLRGEGQDIDGTVIVGTGPDQMPGLGVVVFKSSTSMSPIESGTTQKITSEIVPVGSRTFEVENGSMYAVGNRLIIQHPATTAWLEAIRYGDTAGDAVPWVPLQDDLTMKFQGTVSAIIGNKIKLDSPIYSELRRSLSQATVSRHSGAGVLSECGIENVRVVSENTTTDPQNEAHRADCIHFINVRNCWAFNSTAVGFIQGGIRFTNSIRSTVLDCSALDPISQIAGGRRYSFRVENDCHDILFKGCRARKGRREFVASGTAKTSGIVFTQCSASGSYASSENHRRWGSSILWDDITFSNPDDSAAFSLGLGHNRGNFGTSHGWTGSGMVGWNVTGKKIVVQQPPLGQNYAIGCKGIVNNQGPWIFPLGFVEGTGRMPSIASLYEAQLAERMTYGVGPDTPARLRVTAGAILSWTDIALDETSYVIERSSNNGANYSVLATRAANTIAYTDSTAKGGATYTYRVKAVNAAGSSAYGNPVSIVIPAVNVTCFIDIPAGNVTTNVGSTLSVKVGVSDSDGAELVEIFLNGTEVAMDPNSPFEFNLLLPQAGTYALTARVKDLIGRYTVSSNTRTITVRPVVQTTTVPWVRNLTLDSARSSLTNAGLEVGTVSSDYRSTFEKGRIFSQTPGGGVVTDRGSSVNLAVSLGPPPSVIVTFTSVAAHDGYVDESSRVNVGGTLSSNMISGSAIRVGDVGGAKKDKVKQSRGFLSFNTSSLPDTAVITAAVLKLKCGAIVGNPSGFGTLNVDIRDSPTGFGSSLALEVGDFQAEASRPNVGTLSYPSSANTWVSAALNTNGTSRINKTGHTQFRIRFTLRSDGDKVDDYLGFFPGEATVATDRPVLEVTYNVNLEQNIIV